MPIVFGNVQKGSKCSDVHIVCIREPFEYYFMEFPLPLSRIFFFVDFFHWMGVPLSPHFRACINSYISQVMINLVRCSMSSGQRRQGALLIEVWAARSSSFSWCLPLRRSDSGKPLLTRVLVLSATSFYFFFGFSSCQSTEMKINNWQWHSLTALAYWLPDNRMWHF